MRTELMLEPWGFRHPAGSAADDFCESVFFTGNGRLGLRGYLPFEKDPRPVKRGLYMAGIFGEIKPGITDFVNLPTPVCERLYINGLEAELSGGVERELDMRAALFTAHFGLEAGGRRVRLVYRRFIHSELPALIVQHFSFEAEADAELELRGGIMAESCNSPIPDDQTKDNGELICLALPTARRQHRGGCGMSFEIRGSGLRVDEDVYYKGAGFDISGGDSVCCRISLRAGQSAELTKLCCVLSSRDVDERIAPPPSHWDYEGLFRTHRAEWQRIWQRCDLVPRGFDDELLCALRFSMMNLVSSCSGRDATVSIGARGLSHGRYKGCYFWDTDMFMLPFFIRNDPQAARSLCLYRCLSLEAAKRHSRGMNTRGARFPWMAALDGSEQCETWDIGCSELHVTADVAYAIDKYCRDTGDEEFYLEHAAELFVETGRFWQSRISPRADGSADILFCKGPDEYCGITNNNLFTNMMAAHNLRLAAEAALVLKESRVDKYRALGLSDEETAEFTRLADALKTPRDEAGRLRQDDSFHLLEPVDIALIKQGDEASYHGVCFDRLQRYKLIKQADVLLLMTRMPDAFTAEEKRMAWEDFEPLCLHDSTLSFASHALFALQNGMHRQGLEYLRKALLLDLRDIMGNTGREGLHLACMGEAWQAALAWDEA